jgi:hypothetical protein
MLRTNLSTRPFYNVRAVRAVLGLFALVVVAFTLFNVVQLISLSARQRTLSADAVRAENEAARLRSQAAAFRARIDPRELASVSADAKEANAIIDRRAFSWTTLSRSSSRRCRPDVRITAVSRAASRTAPSPSTSACRRGASKTSRPFIEALEARNAVQAKCCVEEQTGDLRPDRSDHRRPSTC